MILLVLPPNCNITINTISSYIINTYNFLNSQTSHQFNKIQKYKHWPLWHLIFILIARTNTQLQLTFTENTNKLTTNLLQIPPLIFAAANINYNTFIPTFHQIPIDNKIRTVIKHIQQANYTAIWHSQQRTQNWNSIHNTIDWEATHKYINMHNIPNSFHTSPKYSTIKVFKIKI